MGAGLSMQTVVRFIALLRTINAQGPMSLTEMTRATGMPYATVVRIADTMRHHGLIEREADHKRYRVAAMALSLSIGFQAPQRLASAARPTIETLTAQVGWPVVVMTRVGRSMISRASTHHLTSWAYGPCHDGATVPIEHSASGHAFIAHAPRSDREDIAREIERSSVPHPALERLLRSQLLERIRSEGFATYERNPHADHPGKTSALSVPIWLDHELHGTLTLVFFSSAMPVAMALHRYLDQMRRASNAIGAALAALPPSGETNRRQRLSETVGACLSPVLGTAPVMSCASRAGEERLAPMAVAAL